LIESGLDTVPQSKRLNKPELSCTKNSGWTLEAE
jgi:hypothetical protein